MQNPDTESTFICANKQLTSLQIFSYINTKLLFQCFDLDSMNDTSYVVRKRQQFAYLCGEKESRRCLEKVKSHSTVFCHPLTDTLSSECHFFPQNSSFFSVTMRNPDGHNAFCVSELQVRCPEEVTWDRKAAHNVLDQRDMTFKRLLERRTVNPSAPKEYYNLIMESDLDHNRIYGCLENGFGSDVCSEAAKRWPMIMATEAKYPLTAHVLTVFTTLWIK